VKSVCFAATLLVLAVASCARVLAAEDGVALAIVYDTSGSMKETVKTSDGKQSPKYVIANRALLKVVDQIQSFATNNSNDAPRKIDAGMFIFSNGTVKEAVKFGPFDPSAMRQFAGSFSRPDGNTPLGNALSTASKCVLDSPLARKHVLFITDGINTVGPKPEAVMPAILKRAQSSGSVLSVHFVAFDVAANEFKGVKKLGATVVGASDETELNTQLNFILQKHILLESEELPKTK